jgi:hypothetical protein
MQAVAGGTSIFCNREQAPPLVKVWVPTVALGHAQQQVSDVIDLTADSD